MVQGVVGDQRRRSVVGAAVAAAAGHDLRCPAPQRPAGERGGGDDGGERHPEHRERDERCHGEGHEGGVAQRLLPDPHHCLGDDGEHRRREPGEQCGDRGGVAVADVERGEREQGGHPGEHEEDAGDQPAAHSVEQPADVDGQLLRLGAGQQRAVGQGVQESALADPASLLDELALHDGDLAGGAAEGLQRDGEPGPGRLPERDDVLTTVLGHRAVARNAAGLGVNHG